MSKTRVVAKRSTTFQDISQAGIWQHPSTWIMQIGSMLDEAPPWWSKRRDEWLVDFWKLPGNDLLAGAISTLAAKISATDWYLEGPLELAKMWRDVLLYHSDFGCGWDSWIPKWVTAYLTRDMGGLSERLRANRYDHEGPSLGFNHLDESKCYMTGDPEYPVMYQGKSKSRKIHYSQMMRIVDMPSGKDSDKGYGICGTSRAIATASIMRDIVRYKRERLSDLPPAGMLFINNLSEKQWEDVISKYDARQHNKGNEVWRDLLVAFGYDPEYPVGAEMFPLSEMPEHYDEQHSTNIAIWTFALAFRVDPREYWPVSAGPLGTATEAELQHKKARAKGEGIIFRAIEHQLNHPLSLPQLLTFKFDYRDQEDQKAAADIENQKISNIRKMWEASPAVSGRPGEGVDVGAISGDASGGGIISTEEARMMLARDGIIPAEFVSGMTLERERVYSIRGGSLGPWTRLYNDGRITHAY